MANNTNGKIKVTLVKSTIGCLEKQKKTVQDLVLHKMRSSAILEENAAILGMIFVVKHLVKVEPVEA